MSSSLVHVLWNWLHECVFPPVDGTMTDKAIIDESQKTHHEPPYRLYDFVDSRGNNIIKEWTQALEKRDRVRVRRKLDSLRLEGGALSPNLLADTGTPNIKKLRLTGRRVPTLRIMLCHGPLDLKAEFTLLKGATKKNGQLIPNNAIERAAQHREAVIADPSRRCEHELVA